MNTTMTTTTTPTRQELRREDRARIRAARARFNVTRLTTPGDANPKTAKGEPLNVRTLVLHLAPSTLSGVNLCPWASPGCISGCLNLAGRGGIIRRGETTNAIQACRVRRSQWFATDRETFLLQLQSEIEAHVNACERDGVRPAVRLNGTSDLPWERFARPLFDAFPSVMFYDYTKAVHRMEQQRTSGWPSNYSLTFSRSETNHARSVELLAKGFPVAVVTPDGYNGGKIEGFPTVDGDAHDVRPLDPVGGFWVVLRAKGPARSDRSGFVLRS